MDRTTEKILRIIAYPLGWTYALAVFVRNKLFDWGLLDSATAECPTISVGNLTAGGTGKTPHTEYLLELLSSSGIAVAEVSRGHKRKSRGFMEYGESCTAEDIGDESFQIARKFPDVKIAVDHERVHAIRLLKEKYPGLSAVVLDDCMQHRYIKPGISILLCDYARPYYKDCILPYGNLRECKNESRRADIIIVSKCPRDMTPAERTTIINEVRPLPHQRLFFTTMEYGAAYPLFGEGHAKKMEKSDKVLMLTAIANPRPLQEHLETMFDEVVAMSFSDHHFFTADDWQNISETFGNSSGSMILVTEKDASKIQDDISVPANLKPHIFVLPIRVVFLEDGDGFDKVILDYVNSQKP